VADDSYLVADVTLARRLERAEAMSNVAFVEMRAQRSPESHATWIEVGGAYAMYDGIGSPLTQTFGLGLFEPASAAQLDRLETFFAERGATVDHEVSPMADSVLLAFFKSRRYHPIEFTSVMSLPLTRVAHRPPLDGARLGARPIGADEVGMWADVAARGWGESPELSDFIRDVAPIIAGRHGAVAFVAELDGRAIAAAALSIFEGVALLAGASTVPEGRRQGAQAALLEARLRYALDRGCELAMMCAAPGSTSQRNAERNGFRIAYTRTKWRLG
jgi:GNAT superfamily N-acetyltransferase